MSLEALYNAAQTGTYVNQVRTKQAADVGSGLGVNFMDGTRRGKNNNNADEYQREFTRNIAGANIIGGAQGTLRNPNESLTRWSTKSFKIAFDAEGPASLPNGFYNTTRFRVWKAGQISANIHNYTPLQNKGFVNINTSAGLRKNGSPSGAPTSL